MRPPPLQQQREERPGAQLPGIRSSKCPALVDSVRGRNPLRCPPQNGESAITVRINVTSVASSTTPTGPGLTQTSPLATNRR
jgi:hypothetical protein